LGAFISTVGELRSKVTMLNSKSASLSNIYPLVFIQFLIYFSGV